MKISFLIHVTETADDGHTAVLSARSSNGRILESETHEFSAGFRRAVGPCGMANAVAITLREMIAKYVKNSLDNVAWAVGR